MVRPRPHPGHTATSKNGAGDTARPETAVSPNRSPRLPVLRWQQGRSCHDASASSPLDDFLRQTSVAAGSGTRTLRRYRHDMRLEVRNDRYSVVRSRGGVRGEGADAQVRRRRSSLSPPRKEPLLLSQEVAASGVAFLLSSSGRAARRSPRCSLPDGCRSFVAISPQRTSGRVARLALTSPA